MLNRRAIKKLTQSTEQGFSLVEVLMAAIVMMGLLLGTNRLVMQGMATSGRAGLRAGLEQEILNDIESIQAVDTLLNSEPALSAACQQAASPSGYLSAQISNQLPRPSRSDWNRDVDSQNPNLLVVTYSFEIPGMASAIEKRVIELSPSFTTSCPLMP